MKSTIPMLVAVLLCPAFSVAQVVDSEQSDYVVVSVDGNPDTIHVISDFEQNELRLFTDSSHALCVQEFTGFESTPVVLDDRFLVLGLTVRGGSGVWNRLYLVTCILNRLPRLAFDYFTSSYVSSLYFKSEDTTRGYGESEDMSLRVIDVCREDSILCLRALTLDTLRFRKSPEDQDTVIVLADTLLLRFDPKEAVFYDHDEVLERNYELKTAEGKLASSQARAGTVVHVRQIVTLKEFYYNREWYFRKETDSALWSSPYICESQR